VLLGRTDGGHQQHHRHTHAPSGAWVNIINYNFIIIAIITMLGEASEGGQWWW
jgi:hypothetical protein